MNRFHTCMLCLASLLDFFVISYRPSVRTEMYKSVTSCQVFLLAASSLHYSSVGSPWSPFLLYVCGHMHACAPAYTHTHTQTQTCTRTHTHTYWLYGLPLSMPSCTVYMGSQYCVCVFKLPERKFIHFAVWHSMHLCTSNRTSISRISVLYQMSLLLMTMLHCQVNLCPACPQAITFPLFQTI